MKTSDDMSPNKKKQVVGLLLVMLAVAALYLLGLYFFMN